MCNVLSTEWKNEMIKMKYNKKRNTAFLYEALVRELTKASVDNDPDKANTITAVIKEHFKKGTVLYQELKLYKNLLETSGLEPHLADRLIQESKFSYMMMDRKGVFNSQTNLMYAVNKHLGSGTYSNFIPNYKELGAIHNILQGVEDTKSRVLLEHTLVERLSTKGEEKESKDYKHLDNLSYRQFVKRFNTEYGSMLSEGQKVIVSKFITSFIDEGAEYRYFIYEKLNECKQALEKFSSENPTITEGVETIMEKFNNFTNIPLNEETLLEVLKLQSLIEELNNGD